MKTVKLKSEVLRRVRERGGFDPARIFLKPCRPCSADNKIEKHQTCSILEQVTCAGASS